MELSLKPLEPPLREALNLEERRLKYLVYPRLRPAVYPDPTRTRPRHLNLNRVLCVLPFEIIVMILERLGEVALCEITRAVETVEEHWMSEWYSTLAPRERSLGRCCQVSRSFQAIAERLLYGRLKVDITGAHPGSKSSLGLIEVLRRTPRLASRVEQLLVDFQGHNTSRIEDLIPLLPNLTAINLYFECESHPNFDIFATMLNRHAVLHPTASVKTFFLRMRSWDWFDDQAEAAFSNLLSSLPSSLDSLILTCPQIHLLPNEVPFALSHLSITQPEFNSHLFLRLASKSHTTLHKLVFETSYASWPDTFMGPFDDALITSENIKSLQLYPLKALACIGFRFDDHRKVLQSLTSLPSDIASLVLPDDFDIPKFLDSGCCPKLRRLRISGNGDGYDKTGKTPLCHWQPEEEESDDLKGAAARRGLFLVPYDRRGLRTWWDYQYEEEDECSRREEEREQLRRKEGEEEVPIEEEKAGPVYLHDRHGMKQTSLRDLWAPGCNVSTSSSL
ncbi:hypothetical protein P7C70_g1748, partial [Phenoliferia sp. Uapishka_3]